MYIETKFVYFIISDSAGKRTQGETKTKRKGQLIEILHLSVDTREPFTLKEVQSKTIQSLTKPFGQFGYSAMHVPHAPIA